MSLRQIGIKFESLAASRVRLIQVVLAAVPVHVEEGAAIRHPGVCAGIRWVNNDGAGKHLPGKIKSLASKLVEILTSPQVIVVGLCALGRLAGDGLFFLRRKRDAQGLADAPGDFVLD